MWSYIAIYNWWRSNGGGALIKFSQVLVNDLVLGHVSYYIETGCFDSVVNVVRS